MYTDKGISFWHSVALDKPNWKVGDSVQLGKHLLTLAREQRDSNTQGIERLLAKRWKEYLDKNAGQIAYIDNNGDNVITPTFAQWAEKPFMSGLILYWIEQQHDIGNDISKGF